MKVNIMRDEYWPYHAPTTTDFGVEVEAEHYTVERWRKALRDFEDVQEEMRLAREKALR